MRLLRITFEGVRSFVRVLFPGLSRLFCHVRVLGLVATEEFTGNVEVLGRLVVGGIYGGLIVG